jgi:hypothetical protein
MVVLDGNFDLGCGPGTDYPLTHIVQFMLERTDALMNEAVEQIAFFLAYQHSTTSAISSVIFFFRAVCLYFRRAILHTRSAARDRSDFFALQGLDINHNFVTLIYTQKSTLLFADKKNILRNRIRSAASRGVESYCPANG